MLRDQTKTLWTFANDSDERECLWHELHAINALESKIEAIANGDT